MDPLPERPGIDFYLDPKLRLEGTKKPLDPSMIEFGYKQTPIDLKTNLEVTTTFQDTAFEYNYDKIDKSGR